MKFTGENLEFVVAGLHELRCHYNNINYNDEFDDDLVKLDKLIDRAEAALAKADEALLCAA
jgi:hypothetical protein